MGTLPRCVAFLVLAGDVGAFSTSSSFSGGAVTQTQISNNKVGLSMEYIPSGISKAQWKKMKDAEKKKKSGKNLGKTGITSFQSRSFADWQKSGGKNLFPVDPKSVKNAKDLPYMQRPGGSADDADLKKKKKEPEAEPEPEKKNFWKF